MDSDSYKGLVQRLEAFAANRPILFKTHVLVITLCAYFALAAIIVMSAAFMACVYFFSHTWYHMLGMAIGFCFSLLPIIYITLKALLTRLEAPQGVLINKNQAPALFDVLGKMQKRLKGPSFDYVLISDDFNACISQVPRWGLFGGYKNYLVLGLPYLYGSTPKEMLATIAHEYGHVAGNHGKLGAWVYRQRITFGRLNDRLSDIDEHDTLEAFVKAALDKFAPYFNAYTFVLSRQNEYEADRTATELVGADANSSGLIRGQLLGSWISNEFWPKLYKQANQHMKPLFMPYASMSLAFNSSYSAWATPEKLQAAWRVESDIHDTHPCLRDRVVAIGEKMLLPQVIKENAAQRLLGGLANEIARKLDIDWWEREKPQWQAYHKKATHAKERITALTTIGVDNLALVDLHELAMHGVEFDTDERAKHWLRALIGRSNDVYVKAEYELGRILVREGDDQGLEHLRKAASTDQSYIHDAAHLGYYFLYDLKGEQSANLWWEKLMSFYPE